MSSTEMDRSETDRQLQETMAQAEKLLQERSAAAGRPMTASCITFGCQMNARDSEKIRGILEAIGYVLQEGEDADLLLYNTCTVRDHAARKVYGRLGKFASLKKKNPDKMIGLCGCMMQEKTVQEEIREHYPFVNFVFGTHTIEQLPKLLLQALSSPQEQFFSIREDVDHVREDLPVRRTHPFKSGVNIMYGCNNFCSYCIVPYVRGREKSRPPKEILEEIRRLIEQGVREVMLLGQNVNSYGSTLTPSHSFPELLETVAELPGLSRVRFMTSHPKDLSSALINVMATQDTICPHLHLPLQSGSTRILSQMNRGYTQEVYLQKVSALREAMPDLSLTTDLIVGFPGETEEDFQETLRVVEQVRFDNAFTFLYSPRTGTPAASMDEQIDSATAQKRFDCLLALIRRIARERAQRFEGQTQEVLVEGQNPRDPSYRTGRLPGNLLVHFSSSKAQIGDLVPVRLEECHGFYYLGRQV